jgi:hypothetical protein
MSEKIKDDRDLIVIFSKIYLFIKRYYIILLLFFSAGIAFGYYKNHVEGYYFQKHLILSSTIIEKYISTDMVNSIQMLVLDNNSELISQKLNIPIEAAASIIKIDTGTFHYKENIAFIIDFAFRDIKYADTLTSGFLYYLNNNEYYRKNMQLFIQKRQKILEALNLRLKLTDTLHNMSSTSIFSTSQGENAIFLRSSFSEQIHLIDEKYRIEKDIEFGSKISLIEESMRRVYTGIGVTKSLILYGLGIGLFGVFLSLLIESMRRTRKYLKEQK